MKTKVIFSFDTEDFTSNESANAIYTEAEILREEGVRGCFCLVGLLAQQLESWGRTDVLEALSHHEIDTHTYGHTLHPMINEYTDIADFEAAKAEVIRQETQCLEMIRHATGCEKVFAAVPPGNQKSYAAMYAYAEMGIPIYADTVCDTPQCDGVYYCNIYHMDYSVCVDGKSGLYMCDSEKEMRRVIDYLATLRHAIVYTHPHNSLFCEPWDVINFDKENLYPFGQWKAAPRHPKELTDVFYRNMRKFVRMIQADPRFEITTYQQIAAENAAREPRILSRTDLPLIAQQLNAELYPVLKPNSFCLTDIARACKAFLQGKDNYVCGPAQGFLAAPQASIQQETFTAEEIKQAAAAIPEDDFLPASISVNGKTLGPADWLYAALEVLNGAETVTTVPNRPQLPSLDRLPQARDLALKGTWRHSDSFEDNYLSDRLRWQSWTMRFQED